MSGFQDSLSNAGDTSLSLQPMFYCSSHTAPGIQPVMGETVIAMPADNMILADPSMHLVKGLLNTVEVGAFLCIP